MAVPPEAVLEWSPVFCDLRPSESWHLTSLTIFMSDLIWNGSALMLDIVGDFANRLKGSYMRPAGWEP